MLGNEKRAICYSEDFLVTTVRIDIYFSMFW